MVLHHGCGAAVGLYVPAGPVRGQGQSTVNLSSSVNAAEEGNAVLLSRLPAPMMENTGTPPYLCCLILYSDKKLAKMSLQFCLTPCELAQANQFSPVKSVWT